MIIESAPDLRVALLNRVRTEYMIGQQREGLHVSSLIYCLSKALYEATDPLPPTDREVELWSIGFGLERVFLPGLQEEPLEMDGITGTPDFTLGILSDLKSTRMAPGSSAGCAECGEPYRGHTVITTGHAYVKAPALPFEIPEGWRRQFMAYRWMKNQAGEPEYEFAVSIIHLIQPLLQVLRLIFTHNELVENWQWILMRADQYLSMKAANDPQPFLHMNEWECGAGTANQCQYYLRCSLEASIRRFRL